MRPPDTFEDLARAGYRHIGAGQCLACRGPVEWFVSPERQKVPFSLKLDVMVPADWPPYLRPTLTRYENHADVCPEVERRRRRTR